jgi:phage I-like protein
MEKTTRMFMGSRLEGVPAEIQVIPYGRHETDKGAFHLDEAGAALIIEDFTGRRNDLVIDYEHQTLTGTEAPAAGWIKKLIDRGRDGVWAAVEWTDRARDYLRNREYRYLSPVFLKRLGDDRAVRLIGAALTNQPAIDGMVPVVNKEHVNENRKEEDFMKRLKELLGLSEDAGEGSVEEALLALKDRTSGMKDICSILGLPEDAHVPEIKGTVMALKSGHEQGETLGKRVAELEGSLRQKDAEQFVEQAMKDGKVTPAQRAWALEYAAEEPEAFKAFVAKAPVVVVTGEAAGFPVTDIQNAREHGGVQSKVNSVLGIDEDTFRKYNTLN